MYLTSYDKNNYNLTFSEYCGVDPTPYDIVKIDESLFMPCVVRAFNNCNANTLTDLFNTNICDFLSRRDIGYKRLYNVINILTKIINNEIDYKALAFSQLKGIPYIVALNRTAICNGDFSSLEEEPKLQQLYKEAYYSIDTDMMKYFNTQEKTKMVTTCLSNIINQLEEYNERKQKIIYLFDTVPAQRKGKKILNYITLYTQDNQKIRLLNSFFLENSSILTDKGICKIINDEDLYSLVKAFLTWIKFPLRLNLNYIMRAILSNNFYKPILKNKSDNLSDSEICESLNISEKALNILEKEMIDYFFYKRNGILIFQILCFDLNGIDNITLNNLQDIFNCNYSKYLMYFKPFYCKLISEI